MKIKKNITIDSDRISIRMSEINDIFYLEEWLKSVDHVLSFPGIASDNLRVVDYGIQKWSFAFYFNTSLTVLLDDVPVGIASFWLYDSESMKHHAMFGIIVDPEFRSYGIGKILMNNLIDFAKNILNLQFIELTVVKENTRAVKFYKNFGFKKIVVYKDYIIDKNNTYKSMMLMRRML